MNPAVVGERYELLEVLGREGTTEVVRAVDRRHDRLVALKVRRLAPGVARDDVLAEGRALLDVAPHPALPTCRDDFFLDDETYVLVMDWIDGTPLTQFVAEKGDPGLPLGTILAGMPAVADALEHLHAHDPCIVHGDVRPENVLIGVGGRVTLVYGVGSTGSGSTDTKSPYRAPELGHSEPSRAIDIFGCAATTVLALTGHAPPADGPIEWDGVAPELARRIDRVVRRALDRDPSRRPPSAHDFVERLAATRETAVPDGVVTFVLTDVEGSTDLWEAHPDHMAGVMMRHYELAGDIAERFGGRMPRSQGEGDSTLIAFARATDALEAALAFQRALRAETFPDGIELKVRVGMHTGEAQVEHGDYFGAALSRAARLRALARGEQVLVSQATAEFVADRLPANVELRNLGPVRLKGLARTEQVHEVRASDLPALAPGAALLDAIATEARLALPVTLQSGSGKFVGRGDQVATISRRWDSTIEQAARHVVAINGDPGIGKTRLTVELARQVYRDDDAIVLHGRCYEENVVPYQPFVEAIEHYVRHGSPDDVRAAVVRSGTVLSRLLPDLTLRFPDLPPPIRAEPDTERYLLFEAVSTLLAGLAKRSPVLLVLEDLHWADRPTIALLAHLARSADTGPILALCTYRSGEVGGDHPLVSAVDALRRDDGIDIVALPGLTEREVGELIEGTCDLDPTPGFVESVRRETDGNPFFVQEICSHVDETGRGGDETFTLETLGVPDGVKQVIGRRISRLPEEAARLLGVAAVIGREFELGLLVDVSGADEDVALDELDLASEAHLVEEVEGAAGRYSFVHALTREALYDSLSASRRARLHRRVAEQIEARAGSDLDEHLGALSYHYANAGTEPMKAVEYAQRAGEHALVRLAHEEAGSQFERGLELLAEQDATRCDLLLGLGEARRRAGDVTGSQQAFADAGDVARVLQDPVRLARAAIGNFRGHVLATPGWHQPVIQLLEEALASLPTDASVLRSRVLAALALELYFTPEQERGITTSHEAITMARATGDGDALAFALACAHTAVSDPEHLAERLAISTELIDVGERAGNPEMVLVGHVHRAGDLLELGQVDDARAEADAADERVEQLGQPMQRYYAIWLRSTLALLEGRFDECERLSNEALDIGVAANHPDALVVWGTQATILGFERGDTSHLLETADQLLGEFPELTAWPAAVALVRAIAGRHVEARELLRSQVATLDGLEFSSIWTPALMALGEVARIVDDPAAARPIYERLAPYADRLCVVSLNLSEMGPVERTLGVLATLDGDMPRAEQHFTSALAASTRIGAPPHVARCSVDYARMLLTRGASGDRQRAQELLTTGARLAADLGMAGLFADARDLERRLDRTAVHEPGS